MPSIARKRAAPANDGGDDEAPRNTQRRRRQTQQASDASDDEQGGAIQNGGDDTIENLVKRLVRYALACEYSRQNIRREGIREKVIGKDGRGNPFKKVFDGAQKELIEKFGMQMVELPTKEKVTLKERRDAAQKNTQSFNTTANAWILVSILPDAYRSPVIIPTSKVPTPYHEAVYIGLYTTIISIIYLAGGAITDGKLERYLTKMNANLYTPLDSTPKVLAKMAKDGYIFKTNDTIGTESITEWRVGPRGRVEVGTKGVKGLVEQVYEESGPDDLAKRIQVSLGLEPPKARDENDGDDAEEGQENGNGASGSAPARRGGRSRQQNESEDED